MFTTETTVDFVKEVMEAYNTGNRTKFAEFLAEDVTYTEGNFKEVYRGREEVLRYTFDVYRTAFPDFYGRIVDILQGESKVGLEMVWTGTSKGPFVTPLGTFPPTGKQFTNPSFMVCSVKDRKITSLVNYFDSASVLVQLGLIPELVFTPA